MKGKRNWAFALILAGALAVASVAAACGGGEEKGTMTGSMASHMAQATDKMNAMMSAAKQGNMGAAKTALQQADDSLHAIIDELKAENPKLAVDLEEAVEDAEKDLEEGADADHIVEIGNEILSLLKKAE